jgi:DNA-binding SARP family transcriptional activator
MRGKPAPDIQQRLIQHAQYSEKAKACAQEGLQHIEAGRTAKARSCYAQAKKWHQMALKLEPSHRLTSMGRGPDQEPLGSGDTRRRPRSA